MEPDETLILKNVDALKVYFDPFRLKIINKLVSQPRTIHEIAEMLNVPFTRLYYQFNLLEQHKIIRVVGTRNKAGAVEEKLYRIAALQFIISREFTTSDTGEISPSLQAILDTVFDDVRHDIERNIRNGTIDLQALSPDSDALLVRRGVFTLSPLQAEQLHQDLNAVLRRYKEVTQEPDAREYSLSVALFPTKLEIQDEA